MARTALELSYKALFNAMLRQSHELTDNKRVLDKHTRIESLLVNLREEGLPEEELQYVSVFFIYTSATHLFITVKKNLHFTDC